MGFGINSYDGPGAAMPGSGPSHTAKRDAVKRSHRSIMNKFREIGDQALNAADYEATMNLPLNKRKACDPVTGDFDADASRPVFNPHNAPKYPFQLHSTVTEGEHIEVHSAEEHKNALATGKWADKPLEKKRRFMLSPENQMDNLNMQVLAERSRGLELERKMQELIASKNETVIVTEANQVEIRRIELEQKEAELDRKMKQFEEIMARHSASLKKEEDADEDDSEDDELVTTSSKPASRRK